MTDSQEIFSRDGKLKAVLNRRADGKYLVEFHQWKHEDSIDFGVQESWVKLPGASLVESLADAVEFASRHVGAGTEDFFDDNGF